MNALEVGQKLVELVNAGRESEASFVTDYYDDNVVSIEGGGDGAEGSGPPPRMEGIDAIRGKHEWWYDNNEVHGTTASGPYVGHRDDQFIVRFVMDMTPKYGDRIQMDEVGLFTVANGKVVQEEYLYLMG